MKRKLNLLVFILACISSEVPTGSSEMSMAKANCAFQNVNDLWGYFAKELMYKKFKGYKCDITRSDFSFDLNKNDHLIKNQMLDLIDNIIYGNEITIEMNWSKKHKQSLLTRQFDMFAFLDYFIDFNYYIDLRIVNLHGFELNLFEQSFNDTWKIENNSLKSIFLINSDLKFIIKGKSEINCKDIARNKSNIASLFQIPMVFLADQKSNIIYFFGCRYTQILCPLVFQNSKLSRIYFFDLVNTFYRTNLIRFENETFTDLNLII